MIGSFGKVSFEVSDKKVLSLNQELSRTRTAKLAEHNPIYGIGMLRFQGRELIEATFSMTLVSTLNKDIQSDIKKLIGMFELGEYNPLIFGGQVFGEFPFIISSIGEKNSFYNKSTGTFDVVELDISVKEYVENPKAYNDAIEQRKSTNIATTSQEDQADVEEEQGGVA